MDRFEKLDYRIKAGIRDAKDEKIHGACQIVLSFL